MVSRNSSQIIRAKALLNVQLEVLNFEWYSSNLCIRTWLWLNILFFHVEHTFRKLLIMQYC